MVLTPRLRFSSALMQSMVWHVSQLLSGDLRLERCPTLPPHEHMQTVAGGERAPGVGTGVQGEGKLICVCIS